MQQDADECFNFMINQFKSGGLKIDIDGKDVNLIDHFSAN